MVVQYAVSDVSTLTVTTEGKYTHKYHKNEELTGAEGNGSHLVDVGPKLNTYQREGYIGRTTVMFSLRCSTLNGVRGYAVVDAGPKLNACSRELCSVTRSIVHHACKNLRWKNCCLVLNAQRFS
jgi:hypothetical protein